MLEIVLLILKIAGIILAVVLGILITVICCVLFVPVRYRGDFSVGDTEDEKKEIDAILRATWLLRLVRVYVSYEESVRVRIKLLFFTLMDTAREKKEQKEKKKPEKGRKERGKKKKRTEREEAVQENESSEKAEKQVGHECDENSEKPIEDAGGEKTAEDESDKKAEERTGDITQDSAAEEEPPRKRGGSRSKRSKKKPSSKEKNGIKKRISDILQTIRDFCDKLRGIKEKAERAKELWNSAHMPSSKNLLWKQFLYLLKHTKPKKLEGYLRFGFDDPSATGYAMAVYGISCSIWKPRLSVEPDFEKQVLACHVRIKGKIRAWHFLKAALVLFFSKDIRRTIKDIKEL